MVREESIQELMANTENRVSNRTHWKDLKNIQVLSGRDNFFFAFKSLNESTEVGSNFSDILKADQDSGGLMEPDFKLREYYNFRRGDLLCYDSLPEEFYLRKIFYYCQSENKGKKFYNVKEARKVKDEDCWNTKLCKDILNMRKDERNVEIQKFNQMIINEGERPVLPAEECELLTIEDVDEIRLESNIKEMIGDNEVFKKLFNEFVKNKRTNPGCLVVDDPYELMDRDDMRVLMLAYKTKTFDKGKGNTILSPIITFFENLHSWTKIS